MIKDGINDIEIRKLSAGSIFKLCQILESGDGWKQLMAVIPVACKQGNPPKYTNEHIKLIETAGRCQKRPFSEILLEEWGTSGKCRPTVSVLLQCLQNTELYRAADYVAVELLKEPPPPRPSYGPAAPITDTPRVANTPEVLDPSRVVDTPRLADFTPSAPPASATPLSSSTTQEGPTELLEPQDHEVMELAYSLLEEGTEGFREARQLGAGAWGCVYYGSLPRLGLVAIKRLHRDPAVGPWDPLQQFHNEIEVLAKLSHPNLVPLLGYSKDGPARCLVYKYMKYGSLLDNLKCKSGRRPLQWRLRLEIGLGTAQGVCHLHTALERPLVHRDIKSANILLDDNFTPKVGDFGLVRMGSNASHTHTVSQTTTVIGTSAYMAPEAHRGDVSVKMDVFSFGVVLLELLTSLPPYDENRVGYDLITLPGLFEWCIFGGLVYWLFNKRFHTMVDVLSTRLQEVYTRWETRGVPTHHSLRTTAKVGPGTPRTRSKDLLRQASDRQLFNIKETEWSPIPEKPQRPFLGLTCASCTPSSRSALVDKNYRSVSVVDVLQVEKLNTHPQTLLGKIFPQLCHALSFKKFYYPYVYESVLKDEKIKQVIELSAKQALEESNADVSDPVEFAKMLKTQRDRAVKILTALRSTFSDAILRLASYVMNKVMSKLFSCVVVHPAQLETLRRASESQLPLIFLPLHRSHLDYIVITFILANNNIQSPLVAAGENLRIPVFGWLLRGLGAFFIKRRMDPAKGKKDTLYRALLHTYMMQCLSAGHNFEFFIEGGRTRTGKPCMPKGGLLSVFVDAYMDGSIDDALLVPVSINYERIVDGNFVREQTGAPKEMETFRSAVSSIWGALTSHYGAMRVDFNQPFSLRELVSTFQSKFVPKTNKKKILHSVPSTASLYGTDVVVEEHRQLVDSIARHIIFDCCRSTAVMSTNAVSFLLLHVFREGAKVETMAEALDKLRQLLNCTDRDCGFLGDSVDVINHAVDLFGPGLVKRERSSDGVLITPVTMLPNVIELQYYSNALIPHFILEAVIGTSIKCLVKQGPGAVVYRGQLLSKCVELCEVMQYEFIFTKTCQMLETAINEVMDTFLSSEILVPQQKVMLTEEQEWSQRFAKHIEDNEDDDEEEEDFVINNRLEDLGPEYKVNLDNEFQRLYSTMLQPFIDVYTTTVLNLHRLEDRQVPERELIEDVLDDIRIRLDTGDLKYNESVSVDTVRGALKLLEKWEVVECHNQDKIKLYYLGQHYDGEGMLAPIINRIQQFQ